MEDPTSLQKYLGCVHKIIRNEVHGEEITHITFDMEAYFRSAIEDYVEYTGAVLSKVGSPFAPKPATEELDNLLARPGEQGSKAASFIMKLMYGSRMALPSISVIIGRLSRLITKWTADADRRLLRVYQYLNGALKVKLTGTLSTADREVAKILAWPDADHNGDYMDAKSTSGFFMEIAGAEGRSFPLNWGSKKQNSAAQHTGEAEVVSMALCVRNELLPMQNLLQTVLGRPVDAEIKEDNAAAITAIEKGYSPAMRHLPRMQRVSLDMVHDLITLDPPAGEGEVELVKTPTAEHKGDMMTKELEVCQFQRALGMIGMKEIK